MTTHFGLHTVVEPKGPVLQYEEKQALAELRLAGVMFRARNFAIDTSYDEWLETFGNLVADVRKAVGRPELLLAIDHEGGRVVRPPEPITRFPYADKWHERAAEVAEAMAKEIRSLGINLTFGPLADVAAHQQLAHEIDPTDAFRHFQWRPAVKKYSVES